MNETKDDRMSIYEVGYLITPAIPEEKVSGEADKVKKVVTDAGAEIISEEMPHHQELAYTMFAKTSTGSYDKHNEGYFGWVKFEVASNKIEAIKKSVETIPTILRMLLVITVRENTYLGKRAPALNIKAEGDPSADGKKEAAPITMEDVDKSIDAMVKEV